MIGKVEWQQGNVFITRHNNTVSVISKQLVQAQKRNTKCLLHHKFNLISPSLCFQTKCCGWILVAQLFPAAEIIVPVCQELHTEPVSPLCKSPLCWTSLVCKWYVNYWISPLLPENEWVSEAILHQLPYLQGALFLIGAIGITGVAKFSKAQHDFMSAHLIYPMREVSRRPFLQLLGDSQGSGCFLMSHCMPRRFWPGWGRCHSPRSIFNYQSFHLCGDDLQVLRNI